MKRALIIAILAVAVVAGAQTAAVTDWFQGGLFIGPRPEANFVTSKLTRTSSAVITQDVDELVNGFSAEFSVTMNTNARAGDPCMVGADVALDKQAIVRCLVDTTGTARVIVTAVVDDGGSLDLPDASYTVRTLSGE